jgi:hypothetical protein
MISGKSFMETCQWVFDKRYPDKPVFNSFTSKNGDWVFVNGDQLTEFKERTSPLFFLSKRYHIIVHNSDRPFGEQELMMLLPLAIRIYAINTTTSHPRLTTIPLGFVDRQLHFLESFVRPDVPRDIEIYMNFTNGTNTIKRNECYEALKNDPRVTIKTGLSVEDYYKDLCRSKFVLCPEGTGIDTHRVYEALFCGATPVVLHNSLHELYETLPVCIMNKWTDDFYVPIQNIFKTSVISYIIK